MGVTFDFFLGLTSSSEVSIGEDNAGELGPDESSEKDDSASEEEAASKYLLRWLWLVLRDFWGVGLLEGVAAVDLDAERAGRAMEESWSRRMCVE